MKKTMRRIVSAILVILLIVTVSITLTGCELHTGTKEGLPVQTSKTWALIKVGGGEPLHVEVAQWQATSAGNIYIYTKDRMYMTSTVNVLLIEDFSD